MDIEKLTSLIKEEYDIDVSSIEKLKNVYKIESDGKKYCLKVINYDYGHFIFILHAIKHLQHNNFEKIPSIISTTKSIDYIHLDNSFAYLTKWIDCRQCNYDNPIDIIIAAGKLAELHKKSEGFQITPKMNPRIGWFKWINNFKTRKDEIKDFRKRILNKPIMSQFDSMYEKCIDEEIYRCDKSINNLVNSEYIEKITSEITLKGFCHHDFAHHNVLMEKNGGVNIIDFDYCILDSHLHDLSSFLIRIMKNNKWDISTASFILDSYNNIKKVESTDIPIMSAFMEFPQDFWQIGIQYYWEKQPWGEEFFIKKLEKILEDREDKQNFIDEFRFFNYKP